MDKKIEEHYELYEDMLRKAAWAFHYLTGMEWDDLMSEANVAYCQTLQSFDAEKGSFSTWLYVNVHNHLTNIVKHEKKSAGGEIDIPTAIANDNPEKSLLFKEVLLSMREEAQYICRMVYATPIRFCRIPSSYARGKLKRILRHNGWKHEEIWKRFKEIKTALIGMEER